jgi:quercetin dioxygenase-like cupin family protein
MVKKIASRVYIGLIFLFLYLPIIVLIVLSFNNSKSMEPVRLTLHPGGSSEIYLPQECEEFGYVIKGTVKLCYGGKVHTVKAGESFYFKAGKKHFIENKSSKDAVLIWVSNPPSF